MLARPQVVADANPSRGSRIYIGETSNLPQRDVDRVGDEVAQVRRLLRELEPGLDAGDVEELVDHPDQAVEVFLHAAEGFLPADAFLDVRERDFGGRERRAQLVGDMGDELALHLVELLDGGARTMALTGDGRLPAELPVPAELVRKVRVQLDLPALRRLTIIDTPGVNTVAAANGSSSANGVW